MNIPNIKLNLDENLLSKFYIKDNILNTNLNKKLIFQIFKINTMI